VYQRGTGEQGSLDIVIRRGGRTSEVLENVSPSEVQIHQDGSFQIDSPWYLDLAHLKRHGKLSINAARNLGFPANYLPVTIRGKTYYLDAGYKASKGFTSLNLVH
jgi:hypothetical protein